MATLTMDAAPCCKKPVTIDLGTMGRVGASRHQCPNCGEWIGLTIEQYVAYPPNVRSLAWQKTPDGPAPLTLAPQF